MNAELLNLLKDELKLLNESSKTLEYSYTICKETGFKNNYSQEELESYEALCSRFARLSDIMIQKVLKTIELIDLENPGTVRDRINNSYKKGIINDSEKLVEIRILRNDIAHEYLAEAFKDIFKKVMGLIPFLFENVKLINSYCSTKYKI